MRGLNNTVLSLALGTAAVACLTAMPVARADQQANTSVYNVLSSDPRFTTTIKMVYVAGAAQRLSTAGDLTVFAATDNGWDNSPFEGKLASLSSTGAGSEFPDSMGILQIIRGFFVHGREPPSAASAPDLRFESVAGRPIQLDKKDMQVKWVDPDGQQHSAHVSGQPIVATNGVIYPVDAVVGE